VRSHRVETFLVAALSAVAFFAQAAAFNDVRFDDAYITFRYAQNLASGRGLVFNPGEHVLGTTSPGHALVGAPLYWLLGKGPFPAVMAALGCLGWTAQAACIYFLLRDVIGRAGAAFVAIAIAAGATRAYFWVPLETNLVAALVLFAFLLASRRRWIGCGFVAGAAVVFRPDALVACAALAILAYLDERARAWRAAVPCVLIVGAWAVVSLAYYGTALPHTFLAKVAHAGVKEYALHALDYPALSLAPWSRVVDSGGTDGTWLTVIPMWGLAIGGAVALVRRSRTMTALLAQGAVLAIAYVALHPDPAFRWHLYPWTLTFALCGLSGIAVLLAARLPRRAATPLACAIVASVGIEAVAFAGRQPSLPSYGMRDRLDHTVAAYLASVAAPTDYVDSEEVGTVAYLSDLPMVDHPGLISDDAIGQLFAAARGRPSRVKWAVLNPWEAETGKATFARFPGTVLEEGAFQVIVLDLRAPRTEPAPAP
jgi:hypothetical protein